MLKDIMGNEVKEGDTIALALRAGCTVNLGTYRIVSIGETTKKSYGALETLVRADQLTEAGKVSRNVRQSILHGELFSSRALLVK